MPTIRKALLATVALGALALPASAAADFQTLYDDYRSDGQIDGCEYYSSDLTAGLGAIPADVREYDPGFAEALNAAFEQLAAGCGEQSQSPSGVSGGVTADDGSPGPNKPRSVGLGFEDTDNFPGILFAVILLLGATLAVAALLGAARFVGWDLRGQLAPLADAARILRDRLADGLWAVRDRLGF
ncbi:MAG: hypothetical protein AABM29_10075 [Actinomycetota bacterium]